MAIKYEYYNTGDDDFRNCYGVYWRAQTFTPDTIHTITPVKFLCYKYVFSGTVGTVTVSIRATSADLPTGNDLCSGTTDGDTLTTNTAGEWREISLGDGYSLLASTMYAIVVRAPNGGPLSSLNLRVDETSPTYTGGAYCWSGDSGSSWAKVDTVDLMFEEWGAAGTQTIGPFPTHFRI